MNEHAELVALREELHELRDRQRGLEAALRAARSHGMRDVAVQITLCLARSAIRTARILHAITRIALENPDSYESPEGDE